MCMFESLCACECACVYVSVCVRVSVCACVSLYSLWVNVKGERGTDSAFAESC